MPLATARGDGSRWAGVDATPDRSWPAPSIAADASSGDDAAGARVHPAPEAEHAAAVDGGEAIGTDPRLKRLRTLLEQSPVATRPELGAGSRPGSSTASPRLGLGLGLGSYPSPAMQPGAARPGADAEAGLGGGVAFGAGARGLPAPAGGLGGGFGSGFSARAKTPGGATRAAARAGAGLSRLAAGNGSYALGLTPLSRRSPAGQRCVPRYFGLISAEDVPLLQADGRRSLALKN